MDKESTIALQNIDRNCNDCVYMLRDFDKYKKYDNLYTDASGVVTNPSHRPKYGHCNKFGKPVSFIPNTCQPENKECFEHRRKLNAEVK